MGGFASWLGPASIPNKIISQSEAVLAAAIAHTWFVMIHPFVDGNGRVARLLMNLILMRYGFPIAIITKEDRIRYYDALETSQSSDLSPFLSLLEDCIEESYEEYEKAAEEQRAGHEWARSIASKFDARAKVRAENEYEVWKNAVELLAAHVRETIEILDESAQFGNVYYKDFGIVEFEKYVSLKSHESTKRTWFFRIDFVVDRKSDRYLFFFGSPSYDMRAKSPVALFISRENPAGSFHYERLDFITAPDVPAMVEIGYNIDEGQFYIRTKDSRVSPIGVEMIGRKFVQEVVEKRFGG
jgi:Fic/DOC family